MTPRSPKSGSVCFTIRLYLPNGEQSVQLCPGETTIADLKQMMVRKKPHCFPVCQSDSDLVIRIAVAKLFLLNDQDTVISVLSYWPLFRESNDPNLIPDFLIFPKADINDQQKLTDHKPAKNEPIIIMGQLWRKQKNSTKFKKQFCILQSFTLFSYKSENDYYKDRPAKNVYPLGACHYSTSNISPHCFQIAVENSCPGRTLVLKANDVSDFKQWTKTLEILGYRYAKVQLLRLIDMLEQEFGLNSEGIFRVAGSLPCMQALRRSCEKGVPYLEIPVDEHSICNMIKTIIRQLNPPLLTFNYFDEFMRLSTSAERSISIQQKCDRLRDIFGVLPATHLALSEYVFAFFNRVSQRCAENKMSNYNLGIVFGPNVLRRAEPLINDIYSGTQQQDLVAFIIEHHDLIFQRYSCLDFLHHRDGEIQRGTTAGNVEVTCEEIAKHKPWSYTNGPMSVLSMPDIPDRDEGSISSFRLSRSDSNDDDIISMNFFGQISAIHAEWGEHLKKLSESVLDGTRCIQDLPLSKVNPILLANLTRCIEVEREWRQKAEKNAMFMVNLLSRIQKQLE